MNGSKSILAYFIKPLLFIMIFIGIFGLVWLRSGIIAIEYQIGMLEKEKTDALREKKLLIAERASMLSIKEVGERGMVTGLTFPDRKKVLYVKKDNQWETYSASLGGESILLGGESILNEQTGGNP